MRKILKFGFYQIYHACSYVWRWLDRIASWREVQFWIDHIPNAIFTPAFYTSYAGWTHNQGFFSALMSVYLEKANPRILDFGCGMGNLAPVSHHFVKQGGKYLGIDLDQVAIAACLKTYGKLPNCAFYLTSDRNDFYTPENPGGQSNRPIDWPVEKGSQDLAIAMSVFTHLQEREALRYLKKVHEVLADDGLAIISFLVVRDYVNPHFIYNFTHPLTPGWFTSNPSCPEMAIGVTQETMVQFLSPKFQILRQLEGSLTGGRSPSLQDLVILKKIPGPKT